MSQSSVPVGPTSVVGWSTALLAFAGALVTYLTGDHTAQSVTAVEFAVAGLIPLVVTQLGRYAQVKKIETLLAPLAAGKDPGVLAELERLVKREVDALASEEPATPAASIVAETLKPNPGDQTALAGQFPSAVTG